MADQEDLNETISGETVAPAPPETSSLNPDDVDADADLSRPSRAMQFRIQRRSQVSTAIPALVLIALGVVYLIKPSELTYPLAIGVGVGALGLSLAMRFLLNARRERGLFFIGTLLLLWLGLVALANSGNVEIGQTWPLAVSAVGLAMLLSFVFERTHDRGLLLPGLVLIVAGGVALLFTMGALPGNLLTGVALYWPVLLLVVALAILPRAIRDRTE
jgi:hypothetical protein